MDYEKKYKEALERAREKRDEYKRLDGEESFVPSDIEYIFPELKESEDERIRKRIIEFLSTPFVKKGMSEGVLSTWISWLEKQGEQKPADEVEPKFKIGDWVVYNRNDHSREIMQIYDIRDGRYYFNDNVHFSWSIKECDEKSHLWTIQDAKDGDVLCCENGWTCIFKTLVNNDTFSSHCFMDATKWFCETGSECHTLKEEFVKAYNGKIHPATKEQRALLFQKMKEAGYEWDAEKKELKKIDARENLTLDGDLMEVDRMIVEQKPAWNGADEAGLGDALWAVEQARRIAKDENDMGNLWYAGRWLKSIKERMKGE